MKNSRILIAIIGGLSAMILMGIGPSISGGDYTMTTVNTVTVNASGNANVSGTVDAGFFYTPGTVTTVGGLCYSADCAVKAANSGGVVTQIAGEYVAPVLRASSDLISSNSAAATHPLTLRAFAPLTGSTGAFVLNNGSGTMTTGTFVHATNNATPVFDVQISGRIDRPYTANTTGGAQTINTPTGRFRVGAGTGATTFDITNSSVASATSIVHCDPPGLDATCIHIVCTAGIGKFTVQGVTVIPAGVPIAGNCTSNQDISFSVENP